MNNGRVHSKFVELLIHVINQNDHRKELLKLCRLLDTYVTKILTTDTQSLDEYNEFSFINDVFSFVENRLSADIKQIITSNILQLASICSPLLDEDPDESRIYIQRLLRLLSVTCGYEDIKALLLNSQEFNQQQVKSLLEKVRKTWPSNELTTLIDFIEPKLFQ